MSVEDENELEDLVSETMAPFVAKLDEINELTDQFISNAKSDNYFGDKRIHQEKFWIHKIIKEEIGNRKFKLLVAENRLYKIEKEVINCKENIYQIIKSL